MGRCLALPHPAPPPLQKGVMPSIPLFLRTHPLTDERVTVVAQQLDEAYKEYYSAGA